MRAMTHHASTPTPPVTVLGLGPMGQAFVHALRRAGHAVTVWNRTAARAAPLREVGATVAATPKEALAAAELILLSLTDYQAMYDILGAHAEGLRGKVLVNLSSDTPERSREAARWAIERGARFLTGGIMVPAPMVATDAAYTYFSGPRDLFDAHAPVLRILGATRYVGEDPGLAQLYYLAQLDVFLTTLSALAHATALVGSAGVTAAQFLPEALATLDGIPAMLKAGEDTARQFDTGDHPGDLSTTTMMGATAGHIALASETAGIDLELPRAIKSHYDRAIRAGHGRDNWTSLIEIIRPRAV